MIIADTTYNLRQCMRARKFTHEGVFFIELDYGRKLGKIEIRCETEAAQERVFKNIDYAIS